MISMSSSIEKKLEIYKGQVVHNGPNKYSTI